MLPWEKGKTWFLNPLQNLKVRVNFHTQIMYIFRLTCACYFKAVMCCKIFLNVERWLFNSRIATSRINQVLWDCTKGGENQIKPKQQTPRRK